MKVKTIDVNRCIGKEVILLDHMRSVPKGMVCNSDEFAGVSVSQPANILAVRGDFVLVSAMKEHVVDPQLKQVSLDELIHKPPVDAIQKMVQGITSRFVYHRFWLPVDDFNEAGMEVDTTGGADVFPDGLRRFSIVEIIGDEVTP